MALWVKRSIEGRGDPVCGVPAHWGSRRAIRPPPKREIPRRSVPPGDSRDELRVRLVPAALVFPDAHLYLGLLQLTHGLFELDLRFNLLLDPGFQLLLELFHLDL